VNAAGVITTVAGTGVPGFAGDSGPAISAQLNGVSGVAVDAAGNLYIADSGNHRIRKVTAGGIISTVAGTGTPGPAFSGDGGPATSAQLTYPLGVTLDVSGNLYIPCAGSGVVRKVTAAGIISTVAGNGVPGFSGDSGPATSAQLRLPLGVAIDGAGNLYISDLTDARIRKVNPAGVISTLAGIGKFGFSGDGGPATSASLAAPAGLAVDGAGNLYVGDSENNRVRKIAFAQLGDFAIADRGGAISVSAGTAPALNVGYAAIRPGAGSATPAGLAIFGFRQNNILVSEAGVPASPAIRSGRIYAEVNGPVNT
jgi:hypothetical protein